MAVTLDNAIFGSSAGNTFTCHGADRYLVVGIIMAGHTVTTTNITYNGAAMTLLKRHAVTDTAELWGLINPDLGSGLSFVYTFSGTPPGNSVSCMCFNGANQAAQTGQVSGANATSTNATGGAVTGQTGDLIVDVVICGTPLTLAGGGTQFLNDSGGEGSQGLAANGSSQQTQWTNTSAQWTVASVVVQAVPAAAFTADSTGPGTLRRIGMAMTLLGQQLLPGEWAPTGIQTPLTLDAMQPIVMIGREPFSPLVLQFQAVGVDTSLVSFAAPVAAVTSAAPVSVVLATFGTTPAAAATSAAPTPTQAGSVLPPVAAAVAAAPIPATLVTFLPGAAAAASAAPVPATLVTFLAPVADAPATAPVPGISIPVFIAQDASTPLTVFGGLLRIPGSWTMLRPQEWGDPLAVQPSLFAVPAAAASSAGVVPVLLETYLATLATATAAGLAPAQAATFAATVAQATSTAPLPVQAMTLLSVLAAATAASPAPVQTAAFLVATATAFAAAPLVIVVGIIQIIITQSFNTHASGQTASTATQAVLAEHAHGQTDSNPHEGRFSS
jgi:hypothetical protein